MGDTKGYAIPADKNPLGLPQEFIFPWDQASYIVNVSQQAQVEGMEDIIDRIRWSLGNPNWVSSVLAGWTSAISALSTAVDGSGGQVGLESANAEMSSRWVGASKDAAFSYVSSLVTATREEKKHLKEMHDKINDIGALVSKLYASNIAHIHNYAARLKEYEGNEFEIRVGNMLGRSAESMYGEHRRVLADFKRETAAVFKELTDYLTDASGAVDTIAATIAAVEVPDSGAPSISSPGGWQPRNPTGPGWGQPS